MAGRTEPTIPLPRSVVADAIEKIGAGQRLMGEVVAYATRSEFREQAAIEQAHRSQAALEDLIRDGRALLDDFREERRQATGARVPVGTIMQSAGVTSADIEAIVTRVLAQQQGPAQRARNAALSWVADFLGSTTGQKILAALVAAVLVAAGASLDGWAEWALPLLQKTDR